MPLLHVVVRKAHHLLCSYTKASLRHLNKFLIEKNWIFRSFYINVLEYYNDFYLLLLLNKFMLHFSHKMR